MIVFKHESVLGNAPAHKLFEAVGISRTNEGPARKYTDYEVNVDNEAIPENVICTRMI